MVPPLPSCERPIPPPPTFNRPTLDPFDQTLRREEQGEEVSGGTTPGTENVLHS